jgi:hypothetical protein
MSPVSLNRFSSSSHYPAWQRTMSKVLSAIQTMLARRQSPTTEQSETPPRLPSNFEKRSVPRWQYVALFFIPAALWLINPNWCFQNVGHVDPWYYFGEFEHATQFDRPAIGYPTERMTWNAPGYVLAHIFGHVPGVIILHFSIFLLSIYLFHYILTRLADYRTAFLGALLLGCHPFFIGSNGWDYPEGMAIALIFASLALVIKASSETGAKQVYIFLSAMAWFGVIYTYIAWVAFTPAYLYVAARAAGEPGRVWRSLTRLAILVVLGGLATTGVLWGVYRLLGGSGFFFRANIDTAIGLASLKTNPWIDTGWYRAPSWLFFSALAGLLALISVIFRFDRRLSVLARAMLYFNLYCSTVMVILTIRANRLLAFDYRASALIPGAFLTLAILLFRVPASLRNWLFYPIAILSAAVCVLPLAKVNLYQIAHYWQFLIPVFIAIVILACARWLGSPGRWTWSASIVLLAGLSFPLVPQTPGLAWKGQYRGRDVSIRVAQAVRAIDKVAQPGRYPFFWINNVDDRLTGEYRAIICSFQSINVSMTRFPEFDAAAPLASGQIIILITEDKDVVAAAERVLDKAGVRATLVTQDLVAYAEESYWITYLKVLSAPSRDSFSSLNPEPDSNLIRNGRFDFGVNAWDRAQGVLHSITDCHHQGHCAAFVSQGGSNQQVVHWGMPALRPGAVYNFSAWIKSASATPQPLALGIWDSIESHWEAVRDVTATNEWQNVQVQFTEESSNPILIEFHKSSAEPGTLVIDEVVLKEVSSSTKSAAQIHGDNPANPGTALFVKKDASTQGNWKGVYGRDGYITTAETLIPAYVKPQAAGQILYSWMASTNDVRALQKASNSRDRAAGCWYSGTSLLVDLPFVDAGAHQLSAYLLDWDTTDRRERIDVLDANDNTLDSQNVTESFHGGVYLVWKVSGHVRIRVTLTRGANPVLSGLFFDRSSH